MERCLLGLGLCVRKQSQAEENVQRSGSSTRCMTPLRRMAGHSERVSGVASRAWGSVQMQSQAEENAERRKQWVQYSVYDSVLTWKLWFSLKRQLEVMDWCPPAANRKDERRMGSMYDLYKVRPAWFPFAIACLPGSKTGRAEDGGHGRALWPACRPQTTYHRPQACLHAHVSGFDLCKRALVASVFAALWCPFLLGGLVRLACRRTSRNLGKSWWTWNGRVCLWTRPTWLRWRSLRSTSRGRQCSASATGLRATCRRQKT